MRVVFFDFVEAYAGKPRLTLDLIERLRGTIAIDVLDAYGVCGEYLDNMKSRGIACQVVQPDAARAHVGGTRGLGRFLAFMRAGPELLKLQARLRRELLARQPDVVWTSSHKGAAVVLRALGRHRMPVAFHYRRNWTPDMARGWRWRVFQDPRVTIVCETHANADNLAQRGIPRDKLAVIPNAIDVHEAQQKAARPLETPLPQPDRPVRLLLPGTLERRKGHLCAVRALARVVKAGRDAVLYIPGDQARAQAAGYLDEIVAVARQQNVAERVEFIGWRRDMVQVVAHATTLCLPSSDEGLPLALMEGIALHRPVITTPVGGIRDLVEHGVTGWLHPVEDDAALAAAIEQADDPAVRQHVTEAALAHLQEHFGPARQVELARDAFTRAAARTQSA